MRPEWGGGEGGISVIMTAHQGQATQATDVCDAVSRGHSSEKEESFVCSALSVVILITTSENYKQDFKNFSNTKRCPVV